MSLTLLLALAAVLLLFLALRPQRPSAANAAASPRPAPADAAPNGEQAAPLRPAATAAMVGASILTVVVAVLGAPALIAPASVAGGGIGWVGGRRRDANRRRDRLDALGRDLPDALELLAAAVDGGAPLERSLAAVALHVPEPLGGVLRRAALATAAPGGPTLSAALAREGPALRATAALVRGAEDLGTPVAGALRTLAGDERERRRRAARARAARAAPLLSLVVGFLLAPAALLLVLAGQLLAVVGSLAPGGP